MAGLLDKALDMSLAARMARAKAMGFNVDAPLYHYTTVDFPAFARPGELGGRPAIFTASDSGDAAVGAAAGRNEFYKAPLNRQAIKSGSQFDEGARVLPLYGRGPIYGRDVPSRIGPIELPETVTYKQYRQILDDAKNLKIEGLPESSIEKARRIAKRTVMNAYDEAPMSEWSRYANEDNIPLTRRSTFKEPQGFDYQTFEGVFYPDAQTVSYKGTRSTVKQALDELGYRGSMVADEAGLSTAFYRPEDLRSVNAAFDPAKSSSSDLLAGLGPYAAAGGLGLLALGAPGESRAAKLSREMEHREPSQPVDRLGRLQAGMHAGAAANVPIASDLMGLLGDSLMYYREPESRTWGNYLGTALGLLPFVP